MSSPPRPALPLAAPPSGGEPRARWRRLASAVEGIEVWAPAQEDVPTDVEPGGGEQGPADGGSGRAPGEGSAAALGVDRKELSCASCGGVLAIEPRARSASCPFCGSSQVTIREHATARGPHPEAMLPFAVSAEDCRRRVRAWLGRGWFHPWDLAVLAHLEAFTGTYVPCWLLSATVDAEWRAQVGHERGERVWSPERRVFEGRTVVDWRWESGRVRAEHRDVKVPGTTKLSARSLADAQAETALDALVACDPSLLAGFQVHPFDRALPETRELGRAELRVRARGACRADTGSDHVRALAVTTDLWDERWRPVLLPLWVAAYRHGGRSFVVLVDGASGRVVGQKPVVWRRVNFAVGMLLAPGALLTLVGLPLLFVAVGALVLPVGLALLVAGGLASAWLWSSAAASEAE